MENSSLSALLLHLFSSIVRLEQRKRKKNPASFLSPRFRCMTSPAVDINNKGKDSEEINEDLFLYSSK
jgi:hypothetical protein